MKILVGEHFRQNRERDAMLKPSKLFSESDLIRIKVAVEEAEGKTSGEIVPYVVDMSDAYEVAEWRAGVLCGVIALGVFTALRQFTDVWLPFDFVEMALVAMLASAAGALLTHFVSPLQRLFAGRHLMDMRVHQRALQAFIAEEVFATRDRTGILIFLSLLERKVHVLGDSGINAKVQQSDWDGVTQLIVSGIREGKATDGLVAAIRECGRLLEAHGFRRPADDKDELPDNLRIGDR
jgi:putative membrane protein